jgi:peptidoglycan/LPS O-acetylase OafA/YrhL
MSNEAGVYVFCLLVCGMVLVPVGTSAPRGWGVVVILIGLAMVVVGIVFLVGLDRDLIGKIPFRPNPNDYQDHQ